MVRTRHGLTIGAIFRLNSISFQEAQMKLTEAVIPISEAKAHTAGLIDRVVNTRSPVVITQNGRARVVVQDLESYEETRESLAFLKIVAQGRTNVRDGKVKPLKSAFANVRRRARERQNG
jgi:prevent-host-death family protein